MKRRLFTPGPLMTSKRVKEAMLRDIGSREEGFIEVVASIRSRLLELAGAPRDLGYDAIPVQGSGTYALEAALSSFAPSPGKLLAITNGHYGERLAAIARTHDISVDEFVHAEHVPLDAQRLSRLLQTDATITHISMVHCETSTGMLNPLEEIARVVRAAGRILIVDAMSSFGGIPIDMAEHGIDCLVSSSNKCIEGVPGFAFVIAKKELLDTATPRTVSLDLPAQWRGLEKNGQFRFTPPTHVMLAFDEALRELEDEGGVSGRNARYRDNHRRLVAGMEALGFRAFLPAELQSPIITSFSYPDAPGFSFDRMYGELETRGFVIYPGKTSKADTFRIGTIGHLFQEDIDALLAAMAEVIQALPSH